MAEKTSRVKATMGGKKSKGKKSKKAKSPSRKLEIRHAANGGYITTRHPEQPEEQPEEHAISDLQGLHDHLDQTMAQAPQPQPMPAQQVAGV